MKRKGEVVSMDYGPGLGSHRARRGSKPLTLLSCGLQAQELSPRASQPQSISAPGAEQHPYGMSGQLRRRQNRGQPMVCRHADAQPGSADSIAAGCKF